MQLWQSVHASASTTATSSTVTASSGHMSAQAPQATHPASSILTTMCKLGAGTPSPVF